MFDTDGDELLDRVTGACAARDAGLLSAALAVADALGRDAFAAAGQLRANQWLRTYTESSRDDVRRLVSLGRFLAAHPAARKAVESGWLPVGRAAVLAAAVTDARRSHYLEIEADLLEHAAGLQRVDDVEVLVGHWCRMVDQDVASPGEGRRQRLFLQGRLDGGSTLHGDLDAATTEVLTAGLDAFDTGPDPSEGPSPVRSLGERWADALGDLASHALRGGEAIGVARRCRQTCRWTTATTGPTTCAAEVATSEREEATATRPGATARTGPSRRLRARRGRRRRRCPCGAPPTW